MEPDYVNIDVEASNRLASQRTRRVAQWAHSIENDVWLVPDGASEAFWTGCPSTTLCSRLRVCQARARRTLRIMQARHAAAEARRPQA